VSGQNSLFPHRFPKYATSFPSFSTAFGMHVITDYKNHTIEQQTNVRGLQISYARLEYIK